MTDNISPLEHEQSGFTTNQWIVLVFSFLLGIAAVLTVDKFILTDSAPTGAAHAATAQP